MNEMLDKPYNERLRLLVSLAWDLFSRKAGNGLIGVSKEASMQLQYAYLLQQLLPVAILEKDERITIDLEVAIEQNIIDILVTGQKGSSVHTIALELKCYRTVASSGGLRGAHDIFMKDVYVDLQMLEEYVAKGIANEGVFLVMNDLERFVHPKMKKGKCWDYDISDGFAITEPIKITTPIGGGDMLVRLAKKYDFQWRQFGDLWFMELQGHA